ncbi:MAG TPA: polyprenol monophosphomannose synthase [Tepidisphaeraceae bacterium]
MNAPEISLIVPTLNEAANLPALAERVERALAGRAYELLVVDDNSRDDTVAVCRGLAERFPLRLLVRDAPTDGLSGAVLHGMDAARGELLVVMDADLQHPPEALPALIAVLEKNEADFVLGSRYAAGGSIEGNWSPYRRINSRVATLLARPFAGHVADPMSGFFALRRASYEQAQRLTPLGYKIALELLCKARVTRVREVPIHFASRQAGESKLSLREQFRYLEHLSRLYDFSFPRLSPIAKFAFVTGLSWSIALAYFTALIVSGRTVFVSIIVSYGCVILTTAVFHARYVRTQRGFLLRPSPWRDFALASVAEGATCAATAAYLQHRAHGALALEVALISYTAALAARYVLRKELLLDVRGLRHEIRKDEML